VIATLRDRWLRAIEARLRSEQQRNAERLFTRRRFLLKGLLILSAALALGGRVPLERIFYTDFPIGREIQCLKRLRDCDLQLRVQV